MRNGTRTVFLLAMLAPLACASGRDVIPDSHDVQGGRAAEDAGAAGAFGYAYVARRPLGAVALAEARGQRARIARARDQRADVEDR